MTLSVLMELSVLGSVGMAKENPSYQPAFLSIWKSRRHFHASFWRVDVETEFWHVPRCQFSSHTETVNEESSEQTEQEDN